MTEALALDRWTDSELALMFNEDRLYISELRERHNRLVENMDIKESDYENWCDLIDSAYPCVVLPL